MTAEPDRSLKWGFSSMGAPELNLEQIVSLAARMACPHVELRTLDGSIDLPSVFENGFASPAAARAVAEAQGVRIVGLNSSFKLSDAGEKERRELEGFARWADHLGAPFIRVFGGGRWGEAIGETRWQSIRENVAWWRKEKAARGWRSDIILETHDAFSGSAECLQLFEELGNPLPVIWDTHHTWKLAGETAAETWAHLGPHVKHVHVKDSVSQPSAKLPYTYVHLGEGDFPWPEVRDLLIRNRYEGVVSIEWEKLWHPYLPPLDQALEKARAKGWW